MPLAASSCELSWTFCLVESLCVINRMLAHALSPAGLQCFPVLVQQGGVLFHEHLLFLQAPAPMAFSVAMHTQPQNCRWQLPFN